MILQIDIWTLRPHCRKTLFQNILGMSLRKGTRATLSRFFNRSFNHSAVAGGLCWYQLSQNFSDRFSEQFSEKF